MTHDSVTLSWEYDGDESLTLYTEGTEGTEEP